jgi:UDP:flavonoid glycosyltransferase YjiC (YdhE family)
MKKKKILFEFGTGLGCFSRSLHLVEALAQAGYIIKYISLNQSAKPYMDKAGIHPLIDNFSLTYKEAEKQYYNWHTAEEFWEMIGYWNFNWVVKEIKNTVKHIQKFSPDIILSDLGIFSSIYAKSTNTPMISITQSCYHPERFHKRIRWWDEKKSPRCTLVNNINSYFFKNTKRIEVFEEIFTGDITLITSFPEFDPINNENKFNTHYIGAILWDPTHKKNSKDNTYLFKDKKKPIIFCYPGRLYDHVGESGILIIKTLLEAANNIDASIIISTGSIVDKTIIENEFKNAKLFNKNVYLIDWLPMNVVFANSDIVIHHGGQGSCLGQLKYKIPSLILPTHSEREYNARQCKKLGIGEFISREEFSPKKLTDKLYILLGNMDQYRNNIKKLNKKFVEYNYNASKKIVDLVKEM